MTRAVLSIGSNLGDRAAHLRSVVAAAGPALVAVSRVYETEPWGGDVLDGGIPEQGSYLNAVLVADDPARDARGWLAFAHACEDAAGRVRAERWGPRTLDVDVVSVDGVTSGDPVLTLPHPRAAERAFVLVPWLDADPAAVLGGRPVAAVLAALDPDERAAARVRDDVALTAPAPGSGRAAAARPVASAGDGT